LADSPGSLQAGAYKDPTELKVYQKLAELNSRLQNPDNYNTAGQKLSEPTSPASRAAVDYAAHLPEPLNTGSSPNAKDPEVEQLNTMMDRILDIQHPERVRQQLGETAAGDQQKTCMVRRNRNTYSVSLLDTAATGEEVNAFYGIDAHTKEGGQNAIDAVVHETQELVDGSIIKMRLLDDIVVDGSAIPKGNFVFGKVSLQGERLHIGINAVRKANALFPVKLIVYDLEGMEGIHIPGAITRDVARQSADNAVQQLEMTSIDPSLKVQATTAGINAAKSLLSKKIKLIKVTVKAGYKILLKEEKTQ
ncbi:MAG: conjugative transposon protein TraM, partial [Flavisolibacter sp.]